MAQTILITGASTGIGKLTAEKFAESGWNVAATMRNPAKDGAALEALGPNVFVTALDVTKQETIEAAVKAVVAKFGKIDVLLNNAGFAQAGAFEGTTEAEIQKQYDVNVFGVMRVTQAVLPQLRAQGKGTIITISSCAGFISSPFLSMYASSKWAIEGWAESLSYELRPFNIQVKLVQPGGFKTEFASSMNLSTPNDAYKELLGAVMGGAAEQIAKLVEPKPLVTDAIYAAATEGNADKIRYPVYTEGDMYGQLYEVRKAKGSDAQIAVVVDSMNPKKA